MRIYDPRIGKFLSVDPITAEYPMLTPYQFASNTPIMAIDLDGLEMMSPMSMQVGINHIETQIGRKAMAGDKNAQKAFSIMMKNNKKVLGMGMTVTTTAMIIPYSSSVIGYVIRNPQSLMNATSLTWGLLTDEDIPGNFADDAARNTRNSITLLERQAKKKVVENIGDVREALVAELSGGKIAKIDAKDIVVRSKDGLIGATVDVFGGKGELITVGGDSKAGKKIGKFISTVTGLKKIAAERGVKAQAYMADNTPVGLINKLEEILGKENVIKFKDK